jgi:hypothetical protein
MQVPIFMQLCHVDDLVDKFDRQLWCLDISLSGIGVAFNYSSNSITNLHFFDIVSVVGL